MKLLSLSPGWISFLSDLSHWFQCGVCCCHLIEVLPKQFSETGWPFTCKYHVIFISHLMVAYLYIHTANLLWQVVLVWCSPALAACMQHHAAPHQRVTELRYEHGDCVSLMDILWIPLNLNSSLDYSEEMFQHMARAPATAVASICLHMVWGWSWVVQFWGSVHGALWLILPKSIYVLWLTDGSNLKLSSNRVFLAGHTAAKTIISLALVCLQRWILLTQM